MGRHSGQAGAEKRGRQYSDPGAIARKREEARRLSARFNELCGEVVVTRKDPEASQEAAGDDLAAWEPPPEGQDTPEDWTLSDRPYSSTELRVFVHYRLQARNPFLLDGSPVT